MQSVRIAEREIGPDHPTFVVAEIGINHNGNLQTAKQLIDAAVAAGCDAVKFQKRSVEVVYTPEELARPRESPFGVTNGDRLCGRGAEYQVGNDWKAAGNDVWFNPGDAGTHLSRRGNEVLANAAIDLIRQQQIVP